MLQIQLNLFTENNPFLPFTIPYFDEKISLSYSSPISESGVGSEPRSPSRTYWTYETFRLADYDNIVIFEEMLGVYLDEEWINLDSSNLSEYYVPTGEVIGIEIFWQR